MARLEVTIKIALTKEAEKADKNGMDEIYLRNITHNLMDTVNLFSRGKYEIDIEYNRLEQRRSSKRASNKPKRKK